jgi:hypothetical protein
MVGAMIKNTVRLLWVVLLCVAAFAQAFYILASNTPNTGFGTPPQAFFQVVRRCLSCLVADAEFPTVLAFIRYSSRYSAEFSMLLSRI